MKVVLTIAGTDPSGAAGVQADLQVIRDFGHHGVSVVTAVLAQNTQGVKRCDPLPTDLVAAQLRCIFNDFDVAAVKVGLIPTGEIARLILRHTKRCQLVWDPVLKSGDGKSRLYFGTPQELWDASEGSALITPNLPELQTFSGVKVTTRADALRAAAELKRSMLLKVGHLENDGELRDVLFTDKGPAELSPLPAARWDVRGTGCHLSTAIACGFADQLTMRQAVERAREYVNQRIHTAREVGQGRRIIVH